MKLSFTNLNMRFLTVLLLPFLLHNVMAIAPVYSSCSSSNNHPSTDTFSNNLNQLMFVLTETSPSIGFGLSTIGQGENKVNGIALCRGDIRSSECKRCIRDAHSQIRHICPFKKQAIIIFDECQVRYSDSEFFGEVNEEHKLCMCNTHNETLEVIEMLNSLKRKAYISPLLFVTGVIEINGTKMYGLAQCSRDISGGDCMKCLESAIGELNSCCNGKGGGRVVGGSCNVRYELYPFFDVDDVSHDIL